VTTATGTGTATLTPSTGVLVNLKAIDESSLPTADKPNMVFPHGFFSYTIQGLISGQTVTLEIAVPDNIPIGSEYWKCQNNQWTKLNIGDDDGDNIITITLVDGGVGDDDGLANGVIVDPGGVGISSMFVVPESELGGLAAMGVCLAAFVALALVTKRRNALS
jgi:hypothetical protein